jgi:hypothetical protein
LVLPGKPVVGDTLPFFDAEAEAEGVAAIAAVAPTPLFCAEAEPCVCVAVLLHAKTEKTNNIIKTVNMIFFILFFPFF